MKTPTAATAFCVEEEYVLPCAEALLAGTRALMTAYAQGAPNCSDRPVVAAQLASHLIRWSHQAAFTPTMHTVLRRLCGSWQQQASGNATTVPTPPPTALWHSALQAVQ